MALCLFCSAMSMNDKCLCTRYTVSCTKMYWIASHCCTQLSPVQWHASPRMPTKGPCLLSHQENIHCALDRLTNATHSAQSNQHNAICCNQCAPPIDAVLLPSFLGFHCIALHGGRKCIFSLQCIIRVPPKKKVQLLLQRRNSVIQRNARRALAQSTGWWNCISFSMKMQEEQDGPRW